MRNILLLFSGLVCFNLFAQVDYSAPAADTLFYRLGIEQLHQLPELEDGELRELMHELAPQPTGSRYRDLSDGNYLEANLLSDVVVLRLRSKSRLGIRTFNYAGKLAVQLIDSAERFVTDATIFADGKKMRFSRKAGAYLRRDWRVDYLEVLSPATGDTLIYTVKEGIKRPRFLSRYHDWNRQGLSRILLTPIRWTDNTVRYLDRGLSDGNWRMRRPIFRHLFRSKHYGGYLISDKTKYRPGDTLRISAWVNRANGKPVGQPKTFKIEQRRSRKDSSLLVEPEPDGRFAFEILLDSGFWQLDQEISVSVLNRKGHTSWGLQHAVEYADYQTNEFQLSVEGKTTFNSTDSLTFTARASDTNGQPINGGRLKVRLTRNHIRRLDTAYVEVPWILYQQTVPLEGTRMSFTIPRSVIPGDTDFDYNLYVWVEVPGAEKVEKRLYIQSISSIPELPGRASSYEGTKFLKLTTGWQRDSLIIRRPAVKEDFSRIYYYLTKSNGKVFHQDSLLGSADTLVFNGGTHPELTLNFTYFHRGRYYRRRQRLTYLDKELYVTVETADRIEPGGSTIVNVRVEDDRGRPAKGVSLAAATQNARLEDSPHTRPIVPYRRPNSRTLQRYHHEQLAFRKLLRVNPKIATDFGVDSLPYFRLRFTDTLLTDYRIIPDSLRHENNGQLAVFTSREHRLEGIRFLYLNEKLVYFDRSFSHSPYSVVSSPGTYRLKVITDEREYRIDSIVIRANKQLVLGLPADDWLEQTPVDTAFTPTRRKMLRENVFLFGPPTVAREIELIGADGRVFYGRERAPIGLFSPYDSVEYQTNIGPAGRLLFTPGKRQLMRKQRNAPSPDVNEERWANLFGEGSYAVRRPLPEFAYFRFSPRRVMAKNRSIAFSQIPRKYKNKPHVRFRVFGTADTVRATVIIGLGDTLVLRPRRNSDWILRPGDYQIGFLWPDDRLATKAFTLKEHTSSAIHYQKQLAIGDWVVTSFSPKYRQGRNSVDGYDLYGNPRDRGNLKILVPQTALGGITGVVTNANLRGADQREPLPFASVGLYDRWGDLIEGVNTDINGNFRFEAYPPRGYLEVSYTGYATKKIKLDESTPGWLEVIMDEGTTNTALSVTDYTTNRSFGRAYQQLNSLVEIEDAYQNVPAIPIQDSIQLRKDFRDHATFVPHLRTGVDGRASFKLELPDDVTAWRTHVIGRDRWLRTGAGVGLTKAYQDLQAQLYAPRFLVENDRTELRGLVINRSGKTKKLRTFFLATGRPQASMDTTTEEHLLRKTTIVAKPRPGIGELKTGFGLIDLGGYQSSKVNDSAGKITTAEGDGEERSIPLYPIGTKMTAGTKAFIYPDQPTLDLDFAQSDKGPVYLLIYGNNLQLLNGLWLKLRNANGRKQNNERNASTLLAQLAYLNARHSDGVASESVPKAIRKLITKLEKAQRADGGYGWWPTSEKSYPWISVHVAYALSKAVGLGLEVDARTLSALNDYLYQIVEVDELDGYFQQLLRRSETEQGPAAPAYRLPYSSRHFWKLLLYLAETNNLPQITLPPVDAFGDGLGNLERLFLARLRQLRGEEIDLDELLDHSTPTAYGGRYWRGGRQSWSRYYSLESPDATLLAYRIFAAAGREDVQRQIINHLLARPGDNFSGYRFYGGNSLITALVLDALYPYVHAQVGHSSQSLILNKLSINDGIEKTVEFPHFDVIHDSRLDSVSIRSDAAFPLFVNAYQLWFDTQPNANDSSNFVVTSRIVNEYDQKINHLTINQPCYFEVKIDVKEEVEFVRVEMPIPAGTEYADRHERREKFVTHREYQRDRLVLYCDRLPEGEHSFQVKLDPRFNGKYTINPARVVMEYAPAISGNNGMKTVVIKE